MSSPSSTRRMVALKKQSSSRAKHPCGCECVSVLQQNDTQFGRIRLSTLIFRESSQTNGSVNTNKHYSYTRGGGGAEQFCSPPLACVNGLPVKLGCRNTGKRHESLMQLRPATRLPSLCLVQWPPRPSSWIVEIPPEGTHGYSSPNNGYSYHLLILECCVTFIMGNIIVIINIERKACVVKIGPSIQLIRPQPHTTHTASGD